MSNGGADESNSTGVTTIYLISEATNNASPFIHSGIPIDMYKEYLESPSKGQY